jgi:hypothetical protein
MTPRLGGTAPGPRFSAGRAEDPELALSLAMRIGHASGSRPRIVERAMPGWRGSPLKRGARPGSRPPKR